MIAQSNGCPNFQTFGNEGYEGEVETGYANLTKKVAENGMDVHDEVEEEHYQASKNLWLHSLSEMDPWKSPNFLWQQTEIPSLKHIFHWIIEIDQRDMAIWTCQCIIAFLWQAYRHFYFSNKELI